MKNTHNTFVFWIVSGVIATVVLFIFILRVFAPQNIIEADASKTMVDQGEVIIFSDSTYNAQEWLWEFGDGNSSSKQQVRYMFQDPGRYKVRLTVNKKMENYFFITVKPGFQEKENQMVSIHAPHVAFEGELILFEGIGDAEQWRWEFGKTGIVDARSKSAVYSYSEPGVYEVMINTEKTKYPVRHQIEILPKYHEDDTNDVLAGICREIKEKLQNIVDGKSFNINYNYILHEYLDNNPDKIVIVNNERYNDFYSYCQGLRIVGRNNNTIIEKVSVELSDKEEKKISKIFVFQLDS
ncbi:PKD domain-containing protein [Marinilabilia salmonicolor]|jgi:hypothetical protein|uniref:PKD domain-containing protein n=1 Tax=Marinilabilia salmonicolor TaxID=989 RepID=A0A2T0XMN5_9BACT|nr:PKD domain-containing protein [Marinilabilia salmonicolor]PRZ00194.1 PKD domain-containing protein [Marinilabilia salmonicolor]RCW38260.1 PKD domain-containing protein [Marinilabilia salmonicolor]